MEIIQPGRNKTNTYTATIGFFDGVHLGHRFVVDSLKSAARKNNSQSLVLTFGIHPRKVLQSTFQPQLLTTLSEKIRLLETTGVDACAVLDFKERMAKMSAFDFMKSVLKEQYNVSTLLVGHDHHFGHNREHAFDDYAEYGRQLGIEVVRLDCYSTEDADCISSSEIRKMLHKGEIEHANRMLGYQYAFEGRVVDGFKVGRKIGFPTANLQLVDTDKLLPAWGVYAVEVLVDGRLYAGMMSIGNRPTLNNGDQASIEVHIIDFDENIYNEVLEVQFVCKLRDEIKFSSIEGLIEQLKKDKEEVQKIIQVKK